MKNIQATIQKHISVREIIGACFAMLVLMSLSLLIVSQFQAGYKDLKIHLLESAHPDTFMVYTHVEPTQSTFVLGEYPEFYFTKEWFKAGVISGKNILRCKGFRSNTFVADGYVQSNMLNILTTGEPFPFTGDIPNFPTTCYLRTVITLCEEEFGICKVQVTESDPFTYVIK